MLTKRNVKESTGHLGDRPVHNNVIDTRSAVCAVSPQVHTCLKWSKTEMGLKYHQSLFWAPYTMH